MLFFGYDLANMDEDSCIGVALFEDKSHIFRKTNFERNFGIHGTIQVQLSTSHGQAPNLWN